MKYCVVSSFDNIDQLEDRVNKAIKNGWKPLGGIAISENNTFETTYIQAMIKEDDDEDDVDYVDYVDYDDNEYY